MQRVYSQRDLEDIANRREKRRKLNQVAQVVWSVVCIIGWAFLVWTVVSYTRRVDAMVVEMNTPAPVVEEAPQETIPEATPEPTESPVIVSEPEPDPTFMVRTVYAYTSRPEETDSTPCISASGDDICEMKKRGVDICAANFVPLGTQLLINGYSEWGPLGVWTCTVLDRMAPRHSQAVDVYYGDDLEGALKFGKRSLTVQVLE